MDLEALSKQLQSSMTPETEANLKVASEKLNKMMGGEPKNLEDALQKMPQMMNMFAKAVANCAPEEEDEDALSVEEDDDYESDVPLADPNKTPDIEVPLKISLQNLFMGKKKSCKITVVREVEDETGTKMLTPIKLKKTLNILPGTIDGHTFVFPGEADFHPEKTSGDIIITIHEEDDHPIFQRTGDDLLCDIPVSFSDIVKTSICLTHLDGTVLKIKNKPGDLLYKNNYLRKIKNQGMPLSDEPTSRGNLIINFHLTFPDEIPLEHYDILNSIFPSHHTDEIEGESVECILESLSEEDGFFEECSSDSDSDLSTDNEEEL